jgi:hypothetical protein
MRKKISSKVVDTNPFIERRVRSASRVNKCRRAGDIWNKSVSLNYEVRISYRNSSRITGNFERRGAKGRCLDFYA